MGKERNHSHLWIFPAFISQERILFFKLVFFNQIFLEKVRTNDEGEWPVADNLNCPKRLGLLLLVYSFTFWTLKHPSSLPSCARRISSGVTWAGFTMAVLQGTGRHKHQRQTPCFTQQRVAKIRTNTNRVGFSWQTSQITLRTPLGRGTSEI